MGVSSCSKFKFFFTAEEVDPVRGARNIEKSRHTICNPSESHWPGSESTAFEKYIGINIYLFMGLFSVISGNLSKHYIMRLILNFL